jgi:hypothetical protein
MHAVLHMSCTLCCCILPRCAVCASSQCSCYQDAGAYAVLSCKAAVLPHMLVDGELHSRFTLFGRETCWMRLLMMMCCLRMTLTMRPQCENLRLLAEVHCHHMNSVYQKTILQNVPWTCVLHCFPRPHPSNSQVVFVRKHVVFECEQIAFCTVLACSCPQNAYFFKTVAPRHADLAKHLWANAAPAAGILSCNLLQPDLPRHSMYYKILSHCTRSALMSAFVLYN